MSNIKTLHPRCLTGFWILAFFIALKYFPIEESQISGKQLTLTHWLWLRKVTFCVNINKFEYLTDVNQPKHLILNVFVLTYFYKKSFNPANFPMKKEECGTPLSHYSHFIFLSLSLSAAMKLMIKGFGNSEINIYPAEAKTGKTSWFWPLTRLRHILRRRSNVFQETSS